MMNAVVRDLQTLFDTGVMGTLSDGQILDRFLEKREGAFFDVIVPPRPDGLGRLPPGPPRPPRR